MRIGAGLALIAIGAILRFGISTVSTHGISVHTIGDILIAVGVLGVVLVLIFWAPWARSRRPVYRDEVPPARYRADEVPPARYRADEVPPARYRADEVPPARYPADEVPPTRSYPVEGPYEDDYR
jgi:hypothetical protein